MAVAAEDCWAHPLNFSQVTEDGGECDQEIPSLRVASLNCLASSYTNPSQMQWLSRDLLAWGHRKISLLEALKTLDCDILCLQECDHYHNGFKEDLEEIGFNSVVALRPSRLDGCVTAFKPHKLELIVSSVTDFNELVDAHGGDHHRFKKDNIAQICLFQTKEGGAPRRVVVANTHLYWNPLRAEVKLLQATMLARTCKELIASQPSPENTACLMCGDFNSMPKSDVINFISEGELVAPIPPCDRFLCDGDLNRFCRWLRILGFDAAIESAEERVQRT
jgi:mRNA deadenylase 3'-5' endonuclease subunit Ccr4